MKTLQLTILTFTLVSLISCASADKKINKTDASYIGDVIMTSAKMAHINYEYGSQLNIGQLLYFYRPQTIKSGSSYITKGSFIGTGKVQEAATGYVRVVGFNIKPGDFAYRGQKAKPHTILLYTGKLLECSKPNELHLFGTAKDGLKAGTKLNVYQYKNTKPVGSGEFKIQKVKVGQIEIVKDGGSNFAIAKTISGKVAVDNLVELAPK